MNMTRTYIPKSMPAAIGLIVLVLVFRLFSLQNTDDPDLRKAIIAELQPELMQQATQTIARQGAGNRAQISAMNTIGAPEEQLQIFRLRLSKPLLSFGSEERVIVALDYALSPELPMRHEYWAFDKSLIAGWRYRYRSSALSFYLNFL